MNCKINEQTVVNKCAEVAQQVHEDFINGKTYTPEMEEIKNKAIADGTFMKAPNGNPTNLNEKQWLQVRTKAFKEWFGDWYNKGITVKLAEGTVDDPNFLILKNGKPIGSFTISGIGKIRTQLNPGEKIGYISGNISNTGVEIDAELRGKGFGTAAYIAMNRYLNQQGEVLKSEIFGKEDIGVSAKRVWGSLVKKGLAKETTDGYEMLQDKSVSKVVDENGEPLVVYHGTGATFNTFDLNYFGQTDYGDRGEGFYFGNENVAKDYGSIKMPVFLNIRNPYNGDEFFEHLLGRVSKLTKDYLKHKYIPQHYNLEANPDVVEEILSKNIGNFNEADGYISDYEKVVYNPNQIKSATDNIGEFSNENDDIRYNKEKQKDIFNFIKKHLFDLWHIKQTGETKEKHKVVHKYLNDENEIWLTKFLNDENEKGNIQYDANLSEKAIEDFIKEKGLSYWFRVKPVYKFGTTKLIGKKLVFDKEGLNDDILEHFDINDIATETGDKYNLTLLGFLEKRLGVPFKSITQKEAKELLKDKYNSSINAFNLNGTAYFIKGRKINADVKSEEMLHPFIASMHKNNPEVFADLLKDARKLFPQLHIDISNTYSEEQVDEELVTQALARVFVEEKKKNSIPRTMQDFIDKFKKWVASIFTKNPELKLNDFTLQDIAELINSDIEISYEKEFGLNLNKSTENKQTQQSFDKSSAEFYSGAANGSDQEWAHQARGLGIRVKDYTVYDWDKLPQEWKNKLDAEYRDVVNILGRKVLDPNSYSGKLVRRDMMQADKADAIFAIGTIASNGYVDGGTGYATTRGIQRGIPVYVFDQSDNQWKVWNNDSKSFVVTQEPILTPHAATIGTRKINDNGKHAIRDILAKTTNNSVAQQQTQQVQQEKEQQAQQQQEPIVDPQNKIITSPSVQESQEFEARLNRMFPLPNDSITERVDDTTLILKNIDDVVALYEFLFEKPVLQSITQNSSIQNRTSTTAKSNVTENAIVKLRAMLKEIKAKTEYYFDEYNKENLTPVQKNEIERNYAILTNQKTIIENILRDIDTESIDNVLDNIDKLLDMYENLFALLTEEKTKGEYNMMTDMSVFYIVRRTLGIGEEFFGDFRDAYEEITKSNSEIDERTKKQMYRWIDINENKNKFYKQLVDDLLNRYDFSQDEDYKTGFNKKWKTNLERQSRKGINDIVGLDKLLFAFDNVMGENTMLNRFLTNMAEKTLLDSLNEGNEMSERLDKINLKLKNIGVDLGNIASYYDVFLEKLKDGTRTWKLKTFAKPEFFSYMRSFYREEVYDRDYDQTDKRDISIQRKKLNSILNDIDVVNIFKFKEAHDRNSELFSLLRSISSYVVKDKDGNIKLNDDESVVTESEWEKIIDNPAFAYDEQYEKELERKLGPEYERVMRQYISLFIEAVKKDGRTLDNGVIVMRDGFDKADNPFFIMQNIIRSKKVVSSVKSIVDEESGRYWDFNNMVYIPNLSKDNLFDSSFGKTFDEDTENGKVLSEAYEIFREIYGDKVGSVYFSDPNNRSMAMIKPEGFADIITTAWSLPISKRKRILKIIQQEWELFKSHFWRDKNVSKDSQKVNKNYTDEYNKSYSRVIELLKGFNDKESLLQICDVFGFSTDIIKEATDEESKEIIANKVAEREADFTTDLLKATKNILQLYSIQKTNMIMNEYMELVFTKFSDIKTKSGKDRINAIQQFKDQQDRGFKHQGADKRDLSEAEINLRKDLSEIFETDKDISQKIREIYLDQGLKMTKNEKEIIKYISLILEEQNKANGGFTFSYKGNDYKKMIARTAFGTDRTLYYKNNINITEEDFNKARADFLIDMILELGHQMGIDSLMSGFMDMLRFKMLGGWVAASFSGMKNRIDGIVADSDLDACGIYFTSGNLAKAQRFMTFGTLPMGWVDKNGDIALKKLIGEKNYKKFKITKNLGTRMQIMQDMTNVFDKNIANTRVGWLKTNLNAYNTAIQLPEIRNQYDLFIARLMDVKITDKDGNVHKFIENNEFSALDIDENGNTILKDEFNPQKYQEGTQEYENTKKNIQWLTFESETESESKMKQAIGRGDFSDVFKVILDVKKANARANGDYREMFKKMYTASIVGKMIMNFKTYAPERFKRAWSSGNNEDLIGEFTTQLREGGLASFVAIMYSSFNKSGKRVLPRPITQAVEGIMGLGYLGYGLYSNIKSGNMYRGALNRIYYDVLFLRQLFYELWKTPGRFFAKKSSNAAEYLKKSRFLKDDMFTMSETRINSLLKESEFEGKELEEYREYLSKMSEEQKKQHIGNVCSLARGVARQLYELPIKVAAYYLMLMLFKWLFGDDDDDPKETEKHMNFVVMQLKNISESTNILYQFTGGIMDSYQSVVAWQQLGRIAKSINGLRNLEYEKNTKKLLKLVVPSVRLWQLTTEYREAPSDFEMIGEQLMGDELDESAYQTEIFSKRYTGIRGQAKLSYIKAYQDKEIPENEANKILKKYKNTEMYKEYKKSHSTDNMTVYDIPMADFENIIPKCLPQKGNKKDMYGHTYQGLSDRDMVGVYQDWFDERKDWLKTPWGKEEYSRNPNMILDFIRLFQNESEEQKKKDIDKYVKEF